MKPARFILWSIAAFVSCATAYLALYTFALRHPVWPYHWLRNVYLVKETIATEAHTPKWLVVGGSSAWFGYNSDVLATATHSEVVNLGGHAELPIEFLLWQAKRHAERGDTVLLAPEFTYLLGPRTCTTYAATEIQLMAPQYFWQASWLQKWTLLSAVPPVRLLGGLMAWCAGPRGHNGEALWIPAQEVITNVRARWAGNYAGGPLPLYYNYLELTPRGDMARPRSSAEHPHSDYGLRGAYAPNPRVWRTLADFCAQMKVRGVRCVFTWQPFERHAGVDYQSLAAVEIFHDIERRAVSAGWSVLGRPEDAMFASKFFYDTPYHLTTDGARLRTERLAARISELAQQ